MERRPRRQVKELLVSPPFAGVGCLAATEGGLLSSHDGAP